MTEPRERPAMHSTPPRPWAAWFEAIRQRIARSVLSDQPEGYTMSIELTFEDVAMTVDGDHQPYAPRSWDDPGCPEDFTLSQVKVGDQDITHLLDNKTQAAIERAVLRQLDEQREAAAADVNHWRDVA